MKTQLKVDFINYIQNKGFEGIDYSSQNTYPKNKHMLESYLKICNKLGIIDKIQDVIDKELNPISIIYNKLCELYENEPLPEMIDISYHVSKQSECLAMNTLNGYVDININNNPLLEAFGNETPLTNISLTDDITNHLKKDVMFCGQSDEDVERAIVAIKTNVFSFKHDNKMYPIYYGWLFENVMYNIIYSLIHDGNTISYTCNSNNDMYTNISVSMDKHIKELANEIENSDTIEKYKRIILEDIDLLVKGCKQSMDYYDTFLCLGLHEVVNEQKHLDKEGLLSTYTFLQNLASYYDDQQLGFISYMDSFKMYIKYILYHQIEHLLFTYIKTVFGGDVVDIIRKPSFNYACIKGEGDYILVVKTKVNILYILVDAKCYSRVKSDDILRFTYQLTGYRQLHRHKLLIPSYRNKNGFDITAFMIINPLNETHRTLCFNYVKLDDFQNEITEFENAYETFINKTIEETS